MPLPTNRLNELETRFEAIEERLADPQVASQPDELKQLGKEHAELREVVEMWRERRTVAGDLAEAKAMVTGARGDERDYIEEEIATLEARLGDLDARIIKEMT